MELSVDGTVRDTSLAPMEPLTRFTKSRSSTESKLRARGKALTSVRQKTLAPEDIIDGSTKGVRAFTESGSPIGHKIVPL